MAQKLTANRLIDGTVVYWRGSDWTEVFADGDAFADAAAAEAALTAAKDFVVRNLVVNPYLFETRDGQPLKEREIIRAAGPSVRFDSGNKADSPPPDPSSLRCAGSTSPQGGGEKDGDVSL